MDWKSRRTERKDMVDIGEGGGSSGGSQAMAFGSKPLTAERAPYLPPFDSWPGKPRIPSGTGDKKHISCQSDGETLIMSL